MQHSKHIQNLSKDYDIIIIYHRDSIICCSGSPRKIASRVPCQHALFSLKPVWGRPRAHPGVGTSEIKKHNYLGLRFGYPFGMHFVVCLMVCLNMLCKHLFCHLFGSKDPPGLHIKSFWGAIWRPSAAKVEKWELCSRVGGSIKIKF